MQMEYFSANGKLKFQNQLNNEKITIENLTLDNGKTDKYISGFEFNFATQKAGYYRVTYNNKTITFYHGTKYTIKVRETQEGEALVFQIDTPIRIPANRLYVQIEDYSFPFYFPEIKEGTSKFAIKKPSCKYTLLVENGSMLGIILQQN